MSLSSIRAHTPSTATRALTRAISWHRRSLAALCAALAVFTGIQAARPAAAPTIDVVVASHDLAAGEHLVAGDLTLAQFPTSLAPHDALSDTSTALGRTLAAGISARTPVTTRSLGSAATLASPGQQLVPFRVPDASVLSLVHVGDLVSVVAGSGGANDATDGGTASVVTLARQVRVAALPQGSDGGGLVSGSSESGGLVVVSCDPATAARLAAWAASSQLGITVG